MIYYKIKHSVTGLFHNGKIADYDWNKTGKVWVTLGKLRFFITSAMRDKFVMREFDKWMLIEFEVIEREAKPIMEAIDPKKVIELLKMKR
jgi:hypothetical protein